MLIFRGAPTLSRFRTQKLLASLQHEASGITGIYAEYQHFISLHSDLENDDKKILTQLLTYGLNHERESTTDNLFVVVPRFGTISPWSSKATDIAHNCGLKNIKRIERGIAYYLTITKALSKKQQAHVGATLHDRMTETVLDTMQDAEALFSETEPKSLDNVPFIAKGKPALEAINDELGLALADDEIDYLAANYKKLNRDPSDVELMMFAQANSEHCRHKIFNASWSIDGAKQDLSLFQMIRHTHQMNSDAVLSAYTDNASVIKGFTTKRFYPTPDNKNYHYAEEDVHILMKVETHNHPTAISPYPGASTGAGGEIRDEGATGRGSKPKAGLTGFSVSNLNIPGFQHPWEKHYGKPSRIVSALEIILEGPLGSASFNNEFGRPNLCGYFRTLETTVQNIKNSQIYGYHKPIMLAGGLGSIRGDHVKKGTIPVNACLIVLGGPAMKIGLGGGAASSTSAREGLEDFDFASVQRGNPEMERRCQEVIDQCWQYGADNPICFIHDVGAGGLCNALPELVSDGGRGGHFQLRAINNDEPGMSPLELWCNEAQERYVMAIAPEQLARFETICQRERCPYAIVGRATEELHLKVEDSHFNNTPVDMPLDTLLGKPPKMHRTIQRIKPVNTALSLEGIDITEASERILKLPAVASKSFLITIGDRSITGLVSRDQMVGPWQVPVADCAVTATGFLNHTGDAMAIGEKAPIALINAPASGRMAIAEAITNIACARIEKLGDIKLSANWMAAAGQPGEDEKLFDTVKAVGLELCPELGIAIPVGKDSMSMSTRWRDGETEKSVNAPLSLIISAFAPVMDIRKTVTPELRTDQGDTDLILIDLGRSQNRLGGSALAQVYEQIGDIAPDVDSPEDLKSFFNVIQTLLETKTILSYHDRSDGGLYTTLLEMAFAGRTGIAIELDKLIGSSADFLPALFNEELGAVIQIRSKDKGWVRDLLAQHGLHSCSHAIGGLKSGQSVQFAINGQVVINESRVKFQRCWAATSYQIQSIRDNAESARQEFDNILDDDDKGLHAVVPFKMKATACAPFIKDGKQPLVAILREQGVNGQIEMAAAFERAGFLAIDVHMSDLVEERRSLREFSGLVACGGFSYGDVLGAGAGWAKSILFNPKLKEQFARFFERNDSFALGVCNGCQMLSHLHELIPGTENWPFFVGNQSEQFEARLVMVEVQKNSSIFLSEMSGSRLPIAVAHGEGQASFSNTEQIDTLKASDQLVLRYVDNSGNSTIRYPYNPNGSQAGATGFSSKNGRVTIMMPHPERMFRTTQHSWHPDNWEDDAPWLQMFRNARAWVN